MRNVLTIRIPEEYAGMIEHIKLRLSEQGTVVKDHILVRTLLLTGIRDVNMKMEHDINIFEENGRNERDQEADD